ncbi:ATP-binding cassette domain-containing protein [Mesorhizobium amorphae]|uniref:ATP-binding cassette domain-containing protein n=1 Tax=Mesorhizobium amorphae TaxID=71433 RepID=UPI0011832531|nr:ATP-binding cassette domain-containing protein [Mesorhizobium amorphae]
MIPVSFSSVSGGYGTLNVVEELSGEVGAGQVLCIVGRNGVGKSTLLKLLLGYLPCRSGEVTIGGRKAGSMAPEARRGLGVSYCPQERPVFDDLSVSDNLALMSRDGRLDSYRPFFDLFPVLERRLAQRAGTLSGGEKKLLSFTRGLAEGQPAVVLDEPTEGVQWENIQRMADMINGRKAGGTAFIVVEQNLSFAELVADRYLVMDHGRCVLTGSRTEVGRADIVKHLTV